MSIYIPRSELLECHLKKIDRELFISKDDEGNKKKFGVKKYYVNSEKLPFVSTFKHYVLVPFYWGISNFGVEKIHSLEDTSRFCFNGTLRPQQIELKSKAMEHLRTKNTCLLAVYPGFGKTITSLSMISDLKCRVLIIVNKIVLVEQWKEAIRNYLNVEPQFIRGGKTKLQLSEIYIVNALNLPKYGKDELAKLKIGCVIVDECHLILTKVFSNALFQISPKFLIGLSATPYRNDGFHSLFDLYFGPHRVEKSLYCPHKVLAIESGVVIEHEIGKNQNINWNSVIDKQSKCEKRIVTIFDYTMKYPERFVLILCKRINQMRLIADYFQKHQVETTIFKENDITFDHDCRILISSYQKVGTGFSHDRLDMLILGVDTEEYFLQYLGRVFRRRDSNPIIVDIIDQHPVLRKHYYTRSKVYKSTGGVIEKIKQTNLKS